MPDFLTRRGTMWHFVRRVPAPLAASIRAASSAFPRTFASPPAPIDDAPTLAPDLLRGANQIAAFLYGSAVERK